jgi:uncharacterized protein (DUF1330 family)
MTAVPYLASLNEAQRCAVEHGVAATGTNVAGPLLVIAGAGSGKTNTLAHRVAHLIVNGADPGRILLLTFSRRAAAEMERRAQRLIASATKSDNRHPLLWSGTFHALGARLLRTYATSIGLDPGFTIHDREDSADLMNVVRHDLGLSEKGERFPLKGTCLSIYSRAVNAAEPLDEVLRKQFPWCASWETELRALFDAYVEAKQAQHVLDYDDLLLYWGEVMKVPELARDIGDRFDHVLVDEYQDTNALQAAILLALKPDGAGLMVVGDDAQAIYGFRAATVRNIPRESPCEVFREPAPRLRVRRCYPRPHCCDQRGCDPIVAEAAVANDREEPRGNQLAQVAARRRARDIGAVSKLGSRQRLAAHKGVEHRRSRGVTHESGHLHQICRRDHRQPYRCHRKHINPNSSAWAEPFARDNREPLSKDALQPYSSKGAHVGMEDGMVAYWVARAKVNDPDQYRKYADLAPGILQKFGGKFLARGGKFKILEGPEKFHRFVVIEFPSLEKAVACHSSPEYLEAAAHRRKDGAGELEIVIVESI